MQCRAEQRGVDVVQFAIGVGGSAAVTSAMPRRI